MQCFQNKLDDAQMNLPSPQVPVRLRKYHLCSAVLIISLNHPFKHRIAFHLPELIQVDVKIHFIVNNKIALDIVAVLKRFSPYIQANPFNFSFVENRRHRFVADAYLSHIPAGARCCPRELP